MLYNVNFVSWAWCKTSSPLSSHVLTSTGVWFTILLLLQRSNHWWSCWTARAFHQQPDSFLSCVSGHKVSHGWTCAVLNVCFEKLFYITLTGVVLITRTISEDQSFVIVLTHALSVLCAPVFLPPSVASQWRSDVEWYVFTGPDQSFAKSLCGYGF